MKKFFAKGFLLIILFLEITIVINSNVSYANSTKSSFITHKKYAGTYSYEGEKRNYKKGWYDLIINKITSKGKMEFIISKGGLNASPLYETDIIKTRIKKNKAVFKYQDSWGNKGKGIIIFKKNGTIFMKLKQTYTAEFKRSSLEISKTQFEKVS